MDKVSPLQADLLDQASTQKRIAEYFARKHDHVQAERHFNAAHGLFAEAGFPGMAKQMRCAARDEEKLQRPSAPANVTALVD